MEKNFYKRKFYFYDVLQKIFQEIIGVISLRFVIILSTFNLN